jgi:hypothetical protein
MGTRLRGRCLCEAIRFECRDEPISAVICHCRDCQRYHSAPYAACAMMPPGAVALSVGSPVRHAVTADSGALMFRDFCGTCGTQLFSGSSAYPEVRTVKIGALDEPAAIAPVAHVWTQRALPWALLDDGLPRFPQQVAVSELERLWAVRRRRSD